MKSVLISIQPKWVEKIASGKKTIEVRKTAPKEMPFKAYIYETKKEHLRVVFKKGDYIFSDDHSAGKFDENIFVKDRYSWQGKVIGDFVCDKIEEFHEYELSPSKKFYGFEKARLDLFLKESCLSYNEVCDYRKNLPYYKPLYGWHISDLKIYDKPKELGNFFTPMGKRPSYMIERPPQSWCYVEEL